MTLPPVPCDLQASLQSAREAESEARRTAADKDITILKLQQQLAQLAGAAGSGQAMDAAAAGSGLAGNVVIDALRQDIDVAHERLREAGRQLRESQQRAEAAEAEVGADC